MDSMRESRRRRRVAIAIALPLCIAVMAGALLLVMPSALTRESEHACGLQAHAHTSACYAQQLVCEIPEGEGHQHAETCYIGEQFLICESQEEEHAHDGTCYVTVSRLDCDIEEAHAHNSACYEDVLICGTPEHTHDETCEAPAHAEGSHVLEQFLKELIVTDSEGTVVQGYISNATPQNPDAPPSIVGSGEFVPGETYNLSVTFREQEGAQFCYNNAGVLTYSLPKALAPLQAINDGKLYADEELIGGYSIGLNGKAELWCFDSGDTNYIDLHDDTALTIECKVVAKANLSPSGGILGAFGELGDFMGFEPASNPGDEIVNIGVSIFRDGDDDNGNRIYFVNERAYFIIYVRNTGLINPDTLVSPVLTIDYSAWDIPDFFNTDDYRYDRPYNLNLGTSYLATSVEHDPENCIVKYYFTDLPGGTEIGLKFDIQMRNGFTPMNYPLHISATLESAQSGHYSEDEIVIQWQHEEFWPRKYMHSNDYYTKYYLSSQFPGYTDAQDDFDTVYEVFAGLPDATGHIDPNYTYPVTFTFDYNSFNYGLFPASSPYCYGSYREPLEYTIVDYLPPGAEFWPEDNLDYPWVYHADYNGSGPAVTLTRTARSQYLWTVSGVSSEKLLLRFPGFMVNQWEGVYDPEYVYENKAQYIFHNALYMEDIGDIEYYTKDVYAYVTFLAADPYGDIHQKLPISTKRSASSNEFNSVFSSRIARRLAVESEIKGDYWFVSWMRNTMKMTPMLNAMIQDDTLGILALDPDYYYNPLQDGDSVSFTEDTDNHLKFFAFTAAITERHDFSGTSFTVQYRDEASGVWQDYCVGGVPLVLTAADFKHAPGPALTQLGSRSKFCHDMYFSYGSHLFTDFFFLPNADTIVYDGIRLLADSVPPEAGEFVLFTGAEIRDPNKLWNRLDTPSVHNGQVRYSNRTHFYHNWVDDTNNDYFGYNDGYHAIVPYKPWFMGSKTLRMNNSDVSVVRPGQIMQVQGSWNFRDFDPEDTINLNGAQIVELLPVGVRYVTGSLLSYHENGGTGDGTVMFRDRIVDFEPTIVPDYLGTGRTALIWDLKGIVYIGDRYGAQGDIFGIFNYDVEILETCQEGINSIISWYHWPEYQKIGAGGFGNFYEHKPTKDTLDLNNNGLFSENFLRCEREFTYIPNVAVVAAKGSKGTYNNSYVYLPGVAFSEPGDMTDSSFRLDVINYSEAQVTTLTMFDVLPYVGDHSLVMHSGDTIFEDRLSDFATPLTGPLVITSTNASKFYVVYTKVNPEPWNGIPDYESRIGSNWLTETQVGGDWASVRAFKVVMHSGEIFYEEERFTATFPVAIPQTLPGGVPFTEPNKIAWNSFAIDSNGISYLEAIKAGIEAAVYDVAIEKEANKYRYLLMEAVEYTIKVSNTQKSTAHNTVVTDVIPIELDFVSCSLPSSQWNYDGPTRTLTVDLGTLRGMGSFSFRVYCTFNTNAVLFQEILNEAVVAIYEDEITYVNNRDDCVIVPYDGSITFTPKAMKRTIGGEMEAEQFSFTIYEAEVTSYESGGDPYRHCEIGAEIETVTNQSSGAESPIIFSPLRYTLTDGGVHWYVIKESQTAVEGWLPDPIVYLLRVEVNIGEEEPEIWSVMYRVSDANGIIWDWFQWEEYACSYYDLEGGLSGADTGINFCNTRAGGPRLPETGSVGTMLFIALGCAGLALMAVLSLYIKARRRSLALR